MSYVFIAGFFNTAFKKCLMSSVLTQRSKMLTLGSFVNLFALVFATTLVWSVCQAAERPVLRYGDRIDISRELLLSLRFSTEGKILSTIPSEIFVPVLDHPLQFPQRKRGRRGGIKRRVKKLSRPSFYLTL